MSINPAIQWASGSTEVFVSKTLSEKGEFSGVSGVYMAFGR